MLQALHASADGEALYFWTDDPAAPPSVELPGADHLMDEDSWGMAMTETTKWLVAHNARR